MIVLSSLALDISSNDSNLVMWIHSAASSRDDVSFIQHISSVAGRNVRLNTRLSYKVLPVRINWAFGQLFLVDFWY